ncbi:MAG: hypothetical protein H6838_02280 [Planctomycetes bacterium]|nr:hypothetical protein [Planctomycetota bacterium]
MRTLALPFVISLLLVACGEQTAAAKAPADTQQTLPDFAPLPADVEVTLATPLVPGVPGSPGHLIKSSRNPNGDSELAYLMRLFVDDLRDARVKVDAGEPLPKLYDRHRRMRAAWPSKADQRNERFDTMAVGYLGAVRAFEADATPANYNNIITACIACHSGACGGPIEFIDSMKWQ